MDTDVEIPLSKFKVALLLAGSLLFVIAGFWLVFFPDNFTNRTFGARSPTAIRFVGILAICMFGLVAIYGYKKLLDRSIGLIINELGITDNSSACKVGLVKWSDITGINTTKVKSTRFLLISVSNPDEYMTRAKNILALKLMKGNHAIYGTPIFITSSGLKCSFTELEKTVLAARKRFQK